MAVFQQPPNTPASQVSASHPSAYGNKGRCPDMYPGTSGLFAFYLPYGQKFPAHSHQFCIPAINLIFLIPVIIIFAKLLCNCNMVSTLLG